MGKVCTRFRNRKNRRKNHTRWGGKYLYGLYKEVPPPPPLGRFQRGTGQTDSSASHQWNSDMTKPYIWRGDSSPHFCRPIFRSRPSWFQEYIPSLPLIDIKSRRRSLSICETKVAERGTSLFQSHFVMSVFHWNYTQKEFVLRVWIVPGDVSGDQWPIDCR